jgi:CHAD domain-containing protein
MVDDKSGSQQQALLAVFDDRIAVYQRELSRCQQALGEEAVHDLRVSIRRLLALLNLLHSVAPGLGRRKKLRRRLKRQLDGLGALRDTQVTLAAVKSLSKPLAGKQLFCAYLLKQEHSQLLDSRQDLQRFPVDKVSRQFHKVRKQLRKRFPDKGGYNPLPGAIESAYARVLARHRLALREDTSSIHRVRVAFKRFRYTVELVQMLAPVFPAKTLQAMRQYQTLLGNIQDADVMLVNLADFSARSEDVEVAPLLRHIEQKHGLLVARYWRQREQLAGFRLPADKVVGV